MDFAGYGSIVIVDDNPNNLKVLSSMLQQAGYKVRPALNGEIALRAIAAVPPDLILLDIRMPGMDGYETCRQLKADPVTHDIPIIFISALNETEDMLSAYRAGGVDYISKPFRSEEVLARVHAQMQLYRMQRSLENMVSERTAELRATCKSLEESQARYQRILEQTILAIALTIEKRDPYTAGHQMRVSDLASTIAREMDMPPNEVEGLRLGCMIHDIGKIALPAEILSRPGRLTDIEFALVKKHSVAGSDIVRPVEFSWPVAKMIHQHHERLDGSGYPLGLRGNDILPEAQIMAVADVVEAMASHRPYRPALGIETALQEIRKGSDRLYNADAVAVCVRLFETGGYRFPPSVAG